MAQINPFQAPINYTIDVQSPFEAAIGGFKIGQAGAEIQAQRNEVIAADDAEIESLKKKYDEGHLNKRKYEAQLKALNDKKLADQKKFDEEERAAKRAQAKIDRDIAIFKATIHLYEAVVAATTAGPVVGQILAGLTAAFDAAQIAQLIATPIPAFAKHREHSIQSGVTLFFLARLQAREQNLPSALPFTTKVFPHSWQSASLFAFGVRLLALVAC